MAQTRTYPHGVPSWVETEQPDLDAAKRFYGAVFGWTFETVSPPGAPEYVIARLGDRDVAGLSTGVDAGAWRTYVAVDDADASAERVTTAGGRVVAGPADAGPAGRAATCLDPSGAEFRLWQAGRRRGAQATNEPGAWNFSNLHTADPVTAGRFYPAVFGWVIDDAGFATMVRVPGYGDHLESTVDPGIRARQDAAGVPAGFADAVAWLVPAEPGTPAHWHVVFTVDDRDRVAAAARDLGGEVLATGDTPWDRNAEIRDPAGATFTASQFAPPT